MTDLASEYRFVAWSRRGLAAAVSPAASSGGHAVIDVDLHVRKGASATDKVTQSLRFYGPGDVVGIDERQIIRVEPRRFTSDFEPTYFPFVELDGPDYPWLFSPEPSGARVRPWLCLVVVRYDRGSIQSDRRLPLPWLAISAEDAETELPDLADSWAWAHAQIAGSAEPADRALEGPPELTLSRLVCPRRLLPRMSYVACVVPTFLAGVQAGLGQAVTAGDEPAWPSKGGWTGVTGELRIPVYHHWEFGTGQPGDFERLVRRLRPHPLGADIGGLPLDISRPSPDFDQLELGEPPVELPLEGALTSPVLPDRTWPTGVEGPFKARLLQLVELLPDAGETILAPPVYGGFQAGTETDVPDSGSALRWVRDLNLDPAWRVAAALGTRVVQDLQEQLMASAWDQAGELERANELLRQAQLARATAAATREKHLDGLPSDAALRVTAPLHGRVRLRLDGKPDGPDPKRTLKGNLSDSAFPEAAVSPPFRRAVRPRGPLGRRLHGDPEEATGILSVTLARGKARIPVRPAGGGVEFDEVGEPNLDHARENLESAPGFERLVSEGGKHGFYPPPKPAPPTPTPDPPPSPALASSDTAGPFQPNGDDDFPDETGRRKRRVLGINRRFGDAVKLMFEHLPRPVPDPAVVPGAFELSELGKGLVDPRGPLDADDSVARHVDALLPRAATAGGADPLRLRAAAPRFPQPMSEQLKAIDREMLLPGVEHIRPDSIGILTGNPRFIEAFMAGLNHELSRELLWRGLPADLGATFADRFWDSSGSGAAGGGRPLQMPSIADWDGDLGSNATGVGGDGMTVLIVRGEVLRRYQTTAIYAVEAVPRRGPDGRPVVDEDGNEIPAPGPNERYPEFRGWLDPDIAYLGFRLGIEEARGDGGLGWFFVIQEQPTAPRFGLDEPDDGVGAPPPATWAGLHWGHVVAAGTDLTRVSHVSVDGPLSSPKRVQRPVLDIPTSPLAEWGVDSAQMAAITYQRPMRVAIHARTALPSEDDA